ncbi:hypothetical protein KR093_005750 [Drosophila rubida]|uniref:Alpha 1,4-glycosyltransferase domain-containing protein n=1 Tax=Drosophila rubida TaxID=30044 RepID=A0AAD4PNV4_9MUSC|nr:hypothetical protein KR093_005750 [Drosophila rubida]
MVSQHQTLPLFYTIRRRRVLLSSLVFIVTLFYYMNQLRLDNVYPCYTDSGNVIEGPLRLEDVLLSDKKPIPGRTIFFHETKCHPPDIVNFTARQACAIESAALHNPNFQVFVLFSSPTFLPGDKRYPILEAITSYKNVELRQLNIWRYAEDTPILKWLKKGDIFQSKYIVRNIFITFLISLSTMLLPHRYLTEHTSDMLRLMTLYRFGGIYMDLDVVVLRSMEYLPLNYVGALDNHTIGNGVIGLQHMGKGHEIAELLLTDLTKHYNGDAYVSNGPTLISRVVRQICGTNSIPQMLEDPKYCKGFKVFDASVFYAINSMYWRNFFDPNKTEEVMDQIKGSYLTHVWNRASFSRLFKTDTQNAYGKYASQHCPKTFAAAGEYF